MSFGVARHLAFAHAGTLSWGILISFSVAAGSHFWIRQQELKREHQHCLGKNERLLQDQYTTLYIVA